MREEEILRRIKSSIDQADINLLENIKSADIPKMARHDKITKQKSDRKINNIYLAVASLAASLIIIFGTWYYQFRVPDSYVYFDINPSIVITTNRREKIIDITAKNMIEDSLLADIDYKGEKIDSVVEEIIKEMYDFRYLRSPDDYLLLSVHNRNHDRQSAQQKRISALIHDYMEREKLAPIMLTQDLHVTDTLERYAAEYGISLSRMNFIMNIINLNPELEVDELVDLSLKELVILVQFMELDLKSIVEFDDYAKIPEYRPKKEPGENDIDKNDFGKNGTGENGKIDESGEVKGDDEKGTTGETTSKQDFISLDEAKDIALSLAEGGTIVKIELEVKKGRAEYEIEIVRGNKVYEIELDAYTGKVLDFDVEDIDKGKEEASSEAVSGQDLISADEAKSIALALTEGGTIIEIELEIKKDKAEYEIEIMKDNKTYEIEIDAYSGRVLDFDVEDD
ncbi:MAG TPA: PepSY domain-containing protein [Clostridia bacterium]|nr:PepSY domain-containing protein [Clostridia bacterium]